MIVGDILDTAHIQKSVQGCECVFSFAGIAGIEESAQKPVEALNVNIIGNANILEACR
jgi:UDP-glucose 4-epimerase